jgi:putative membrane protein
MESAMKSLYLGLVSLPLLALSASAQPAAPGGQAAPPTQSFVQSAMAANQFEIDTSNLALKQASDAKVKGLARQMVKDHTNAGKQMMAALKSGKVDATSAPQYDTQQQQTLNQLQGAKGPDFDRQYVGAQLTAHQNAVSLFQAYAGGGDNAALKKFATKALPTLKKHLSMVEKMSR